MSQHKILIIEDDKELTELVSDFLIKNNYQVKCHHSGKNAVEMIETYQPDLLILDVMLPEMDGISICKAVRQQFHGSILMLTALDEDIDEVTGLEVGADDYLCKPVRPRVLLAHIRAQLRRKSGWEQQSASKLVYALDQKLVLDGGKRQVTLDGQLIELSTSEFELLWILGQQSGSTVSREILYQKLFRLEHDGIDRSIDLRVSRIRKKLGDDPKAPKIIKTVRNKGYFLAN